MSAMNVGVACGNCGGNILMATCNMFRGTGHDWVLVSVCMVCRAAHWTKSGCLDCDDGEFAGADTNRSPQTRGEAER